MGDVDQRLGGPQGRRVATRPVRPRNRFIADASINYAAQSALCQRFDPAANPASRAGAGTHMLGDRVPTGRPRRPLRVWCWIATPCCRNSSRHGLVVFEREQPSRRRTCSLDVRDNYRACSLRRRLVGQQPPAASHVEQFHHSYPTSKMQECRSPSIGDQLVSRPLAVVVDKTFIVQPAPGARTRLPSVRVPRQSPRRTHDTSPLAMKPKPAVYRHRRRRQFGHGCWAATPSPQASRTKASSHLTSTQSRSQPVATEPLWRVQAPMRRRSAPRRAVDQHGRPGSGNPARVPYFAGLACAALQSVQYAISQNLERQRVRQARPVLAYTVLSSVQRQRADPDGAAHIGVANNRAGPLPTRVRARKKPAWPA